MDSFNKGMDPKSNHKYCTNCGKRGHYYKFCRNYITSYGVILFKITDEKNEMDNNLMEKCNDLKIDMNNTYTIDNHGLEILCLLKNRIKFLLVQRKHTLGFLEFIRGHYELDNSQSIEFIFTQMIKEEIENIRTKTFDELWNIAWNDDKKIRFFKEEYVESKKKFEILKKREGVNSLEYFVNNINPYWPCSEWGFPKGKRVNTETNADCAAREFEEESGIKTIEYTLIDKNNQYTEKFMGTNGKNYKTVYYVALSNTNRLPIIDKTILEQCNEIGDIQWLTYDDILNLIRPHHTERKRIITNLYFTIMNHIKLAFNGPELPDKNNNNSTS